MSPLEKTPQISTPSWGPASAIRTVCLELPCQCSTQWMLLSPLTDLLKDILVASRSGQWVKRAAVNIHSRFWCGHVFSDQLSKSPGVQPLVRRLSLWSALEEAAEPSPSSRTICISSAVKEQSWCPSSSPAVSTVGLVSRSCVIVPHCFNLSFPDDK